MRLAGVDHIHAGTVVGKLEGDPATTRGFYDICREEVTPHERSRTASSSTRTGPSLNKLMPVASGGIHAGQMHQLLDHLGEDVVLQFGGGTIGHPHGIAAGATGQPRGARGDDLRPQRRPRLSSPRVRRSSPRRRRPARRSRQALDVWKDVTFDYASTDTPDFVPTATPS